jgi:hypothetical protein
VKFGNENTKLFHSIATQNFRRNHISHIQLSDGSLAMDHEQKAAIFWNAYKERRGQYEFEDILFDLSTLIHPVQMQNMDDTFSIEEIDGMVKDLPTDKSLGPDGFNGIFIKKCWSIIKDDFYILFKSFYEGSTDLRCLNGSFITLVPKTSSPSVVNDYRPISLLGGSVKLITKLLANRLQKVISNLIHANQYGFIKQ